MFQPWPSRNRRTVLAAVLFAFIATPAFAFQCPSLIRQIDAALAENTEIAADARAMVKSLRTQGRKFHTSNKHHDSIAVLGEAMELLDVEQKRGADAM